MSAYKVLLFKVSSCNQCKKQEVILKNNGIDYVPCELFKNRQLARMYGVVDVPTIVIINSNNNDMVLRYNFILNVEQISKLKSLLKKT